MIFALALSLCACGGGNVTEACTVHNWDAWEVLTESGEFAPGQSKRLCKVCGAGDEMPVLTDVSYEETEGGTLMVTAYFEFHGQINEKCFCVAKRGDNYVITTY